MAAAETDIEIKVLLVLCGVEPQLVSHVADALVVHIVVERHAGVFPDATGHVNAVGAYGGVLTVSTVVLGLRHASHSSITWQMLGQKS